VLESLEIMKGVVMKNQKTKKMTAEQFDEHFDQGKSLKGLVEFKKVSATKLVNVDIPEWALESIDEEAIRRGVPRKSLLKMWIIDKVDHLKKLG
jgi:hypothetical protein